MKRKFNFYSAKSAKKLSNQYASFDGVNDYIECQTPNIDFTEFTIEFVFNPNEVKLDGRIFNTIENKLGGFDGIALGFNSNKQLEVWGKNQGWHKATDHVFLNNDIKHVALCYLPNSLDIYLDKQFHYSLNIQLAHLGNSFNIGGAFLNEYGRYFSGYIKDFRIWNSKLNAESIDAIAYKSITKPTGGLVANYPLAENANDYSGNNLHGIAYNGVQFITEE